MASPSSPSIAIICAGLGRTGTMSLTIALEQLGYIPYHFVLPHHAELWAAVADGTAPVRAVIERIVQDGYTAVLENPSSDVYMDILELYPDAKVILTVRDDPNKFEQSWKVLMDTMVLTEKPFSFQFPSFFGFIPLFRRLRRIRHFMGTTHLSLLKGMLTHGWRQQPEGWLGQQYDLHNQHVIKTVPPDRLLVFNVKEGWEPLCQFVGCPVPKRETGFPHSRVNDAASLRKLKRVFTFVVYAWIPAVLVTCAGLVAGGRLMYRPRTTRISGGA